MNDDDLIELADTREGAVEVAISMASAEAIEDDETVTIKACIGPPCPAGTSAEGCTMCEIISCHPDGRIVRGALA